MDRQIDRWTWRSVSSERPENFLLHSVSSWETAVSHPCALGSIRQKDTVKGKCSCDSSRRNRQTDRQMWLLSSHNNPKHIAKVTRFPRIQSSSRAPDGTSGRLRDSWRGKNKERQGPSFPTKEPKSCSEEWERLSKQNVGQAGYRGTFVKANLFSCSLTALKNCLTWNSAPSAPGKTSVRVWNVELLMSSFNCWPAEVFCKDPTFSSR